MCFVFLSKLSETFLILWRIQRDMIIKVHMSSCKVHIILVKYQWNVNFLDIFSKNPEISNLETPSVGVELLHVDGQTDRKTDMRKLIVTIRNFTKAPKNLSECVWITHCAHCSEFVVVISYFDYKNSPLRSLYLLHSFNVLLIYLMVISVTNYMEQGGLVSSVNIVPEPWTSRR